jgi:MGT family glycosyltransferase
MVDELRAAPYLTRFPRSLDPDLFPATHRYREELPIPAETLPDWWQGSTHPLLYASLGSVVGRMPIARELYRTVIDAVADAGARVLLTVGHAFDPGALGELPANVHVERWVEQADVLPFADAVICHGGSGTVLGALTAGRPLVVVPVYGDQFPNSRRVEAAGAGVAVARDDGEPGPIDNTSLPRLVEAIRAVREEKSFARRAADVAAEIRTAPTAGEVLARLSGRAGPRGTR